MPILMAIMIMVIANNASNSNTNSNGTTSTISNSCSTTDDALIILARVLVIMINTLGTMLLTSVIES